ncbi:unnamed protein product [Prunus armeniaca]|nr:hypothetical protein GBA52_020252 [Prunus armeniaca]
MDHTDPYFLQSSNHSGLVIGSQLLDEDNYSTRHRTITISLSAKNELRFVDGTIKPLSKNDSKYPLWHRCNDMVMAWLLNALTPTLTNSVIHADTLAKV